MPTAADFSLACVRSPSHDPYLNLAVEERLLETLCADGRDRAVLFLWQNEHTVVIGRHQNAWAECRVSLLEAEGGRLARRGSGGGAVYHDLGNLNFSILTPRSWHDPTRSTRMIVAAMRSLGVDAIQSGRNDILAEGRKFSGNAFQITPTAGLHHGTLLIASDFARVEKYLSVAKAKLSSKGISSVRARITNLATLQPQVTIERASTALHDAFMQTYQRPGVSFVQSPVELPFADLVDRRCLALAKRNASWAWRLGRALPFQSRIESRFDWGYVCWEFSLADGIVTAQAFYTDLLDPDLPVRLKDCFVGCRYDLAAFTQVLDAIQPIDRSAAPYGISHTRIFHDLRGLLVEQMT